MFPLLSYVYARLNAFAPLPWVMLATGLILSFS
jgi:hypothetical protein